MRSPTRIEMEEFKAILNQEIELFSELEQCLTEKKQIVITGDLERLAQLDNELEKLTIRTRELEEQRLGLMTRMGHEQNSLREFIAGLDESQDSAALIAARAKLVETTNEVKRLSQTNRDLLTQSIRFIEQSVEVIASILAPEGASYSDKGRGHQPSPDATGSSGLHISSTICRDA